MKIKEFDRHIQKLGENEIYVYFGTTTGIVEQLTPKRFGAVECGKISGLIGKTYAIASYNYRDRLSFPATIVNKNEILFQIRNFYQFAAKNSNKEFLVNYDNNDHYFTSYPLETMGEMFSNFGIPNNVTFSKEFGLYIK